MVVFVFDVVIDVCFEYVQSIIMLGMCLVFVVLLFDQDCSFGMIVLSLSVVVCQFQEEDMEFFVLFVLVVVFKICNVVFVEEVVVCC